MNREELERLYWEEKLSTYQIAKKFNCSVHTVQCWMKKYNIPLRNRIEGSRLRNKYQVNKEELRELERLYWRKKLNITQVARKMKHSTSTILYWMKKYNIPRRTISEGVKLNPPKNIFKKGHISSNRNKFTFNGLNEDLAYILGVRFGDGNIYKNLRSGGFRLKVKDREFAEETYKILKKLNPRFYKYKYYRVEVNSIEFYNWLKQVDINWLKENLTTWELQRAFIRGFYDSEGCLHKYKEKNSYALTITNTNREIIDLIRNFLEEQEINFHFHLYKPDNRKRKIIYTLSLYKKQQIKRFCQEVGSSIPRKVIHYG